MSVSRVAEEGLADPSLPRDNGALVFDAPWQGRALAMAVLTVERTGRQWDDFRRHLIACIDDDPERAYWESWVVALDRFVHEVGAAS
ncbi:MAG TPA: nitrile hydratase accessory protein [Acidimicrobiia bacterium]|nr:nitrile hydratase accessory protein [Acidimicrobiia bacterium]